MGRGKKRPKIPRSIIDRKEQSDKAEGAKEGVAE
jgi:hypothetical protein